MQITIPILPGDEIGQWKCETAPEAPNNTLVLMDLLRVLLQVPPNGAGVDIIVNRQDLDSPEHKFHFVRDIPRIEVPTIQLANG